MHANLDVLQSHQCSVCHSYSNVNLRSPYFLPLCIKFRIKNRILGSSFLALALSYSCPQVNRPVGSKISASLWIKWRGERRKSEPRVQRRRWGWRIDKSKTWWFASACFTACLSDINESAHGAKHTSVDKQGHFWRGCHLKSYHLFIKKKNKKKACLAQLLVSLLPYTSVHFANISNMKTLIRYYKS